MAHLALNKHVFLSGPVNSSLLPPTNYQVLQVQGLGRGQCDPRAPVYDIINYLFLSLSSPCISYDVYIRRKVPSRNLHFAHPSQADLLPPHSTTLQIREALITMIFTQYALT